MIQIYGSARSSGGRCLWLLEEIGVPYERKEVDLHDPQARARFVAEVFPGGKIPFLVDGDVKLFESMAINNYLAAKYKPELLPSELHARALVDQWSYWSISNLAPEAYKIIMNTTYLSEDQRNPAEVEKGRAGCTRYLTQLDQSLEGEYLVGGHFTVADVNCASVVNIAVRAGLPLGPRVRAWMDRLKARPAWKKALGD